MPMLTPEQKNFIGQYKQKVFAGVCPQKEPEFIYLIGAKGAGKTTLARRFENTVLVSADDIIGDLVKSAGWSAETYMNDPQKKLFLAQTANEVIKEAAAKGCSVVFDSGLTDNTEKLLAIMAAKGYKTQLKAILADDILAQLNVVSRKLDYDEKLADYKNGKSPYPEGQNPTLVDMKLASKSAVDTVTFLQMLYDSGQHFEVYEYGQDVPAYDTRTAKVSFDDYLDDFCSRLPSEETYRQRVENLQKRAEKCKHPQIRKGLQALHRQLFGVGGR